MSKRKATDYTDISKRQKKDKLIILLSVADNAFTPIDQPTDKISLGLVVSKLGSFIHRHHGIKLTDTINLQLHIVKIIHQCVLIEIAKASESKCTLYITTHQSITNINKMYATLCEDKIVGYAKELLVLKYKIALIKHKAIMSNFELEFNDATFMIKKTPYNTLLSEIINNEINIKL